MIYDKLILTLLYAFWFECKPLKSLSDLSLGHLKWLCANKSLMYVQNFIALLFRIMHSVILQPFSVLIFYEVRLPFIIKI